MLKIVGPVSLFFIWYSIMAAKVANPVEHSLSRQKREMTRIGWIERIFVSAKQKNPFKNPNKETIFIDKSVADFKSKNPCLSI